MSWDEADSRFEKFVEKFKSTRGKIEALVLQILLLLIFLVGAGKFAVWFVSQK
jgi:hypothetical protein